MATELNDEIDKILKPIFDDWLDDEFGLIGEFSSSIRKDEKKASIRNNERFVEAREAIQRLIVEARLDQTKIINDLLKKAGIDWDVESHVEVNSINTKQESK